MLKDYDTKEVRLLKSTLSQNIFNNFLSHYQTYHSDEKNEKPFVYVDQSGAIKLLTNVVDDGDNTQSGLFAVSVAEDGWIEFLTF